MLRLRGLGTLLYATSLFGAPAPRTVASVEPEPAHAVPKRKDATASRIASLTLPAGFALNVFARGLEEPHMLAVAPDGTVYVTEPGAGRVVKLRDDDGDGKAESIVIAIEGLAGVHGIALHRGRVFLAQPERVVMAEVGSDGRFIEPQSFLDGLPQASRHPNHSLALGPDGALYVSVGSDCAACREPHPYLATLLRIDPAGVPEVFATGLKNTLGFAWHPESRELWGMDEGGEARGDKEPLVELNRIGFGGNYGWPYSFGKGVIDPLIDDPPGTTKVAWVRDAQPAILEYQGHGAPGAMVFYDASAFPPPYRGDAFVALGGASEKKPASGYKVVRLKFKAGQPRGFEDFLTGFLIDGGRAQFGSPSGLAIDRTGALLVSDEENGVIYRISYAR